MRRLKNSPAFYMLLWLFLVLAPAAYAVLSENGLTLLTRSIGGALRSIGAAAERFESAKPAAERRQDNS